MTTVTAGSAHHVAYHLFDVDQGKVSSLNPTVTVYPGQPVLLTGTSQVLDQYGTLLCSQKLENVVSALTPSVNAPRLLIIPLKGVMCSGGITTT